MSILSRVNIATDFTAFKRQKEAVQQEANKVIAQKITTIVAELKAIETIAEATGVKVHLWQLSSALESTREATESGWNSSSDNC